MSSRPEIQAERLANLTEKTPDRLRRKLDKPPQAALDWNWLAREASWSIETGNEQVQLHPEKNAITSLKQIRCSCLLSPRCYHVLAVLSVLKLASEPEPSCEPAQETPEAIEDKPTDLSPEQIAAAKTIRAAGAAILSAGSRAAGALLQSQILRAIHDCRGVRLHRLSFAGLRVVENIRRLREDDEAFRTEELTADLLEMLRIGIARDHPALPDRENLELLARIPDLESRWIVCLMTKMAKSPGQVSALAVGPRGTFDNESHWQLPGDWEGRSNLGLDRLKRGHFQVAEPQPRRIEPAPNPPSPTERIKLASAIPPTHPIWPSAGSPPRFTKTPLVGIFRNGTGSKASKTDSFDQMMYDDPMLGGQVELPIVRRRSDGNPNCHSKIFRIDETI